MIHNIEDLKGRALVESNILKQFILSASARDRGEFKPQLDDILIHDYQMANSVTLNVILSNYMVDLAYALDCIQNPIYGGSTDSYFKLVRGLDVDANVSLPDQTHLILDVSNGDGTFKTRDLVLGLKELWNEKEQVDQFVNLDSTWYCRKIVDGHDTLQVVDVDGMNDHKGSIDNPFDKKLVGMEMSFNQWLAKNGRLSCIVENRFYKNVFADAEIGGFGGVILDCRYLLCVPGGFYGLQPQWETNGDFAGFVLQDIGKMLPILDESKEFRYKFCGFHVIGSSDEITLFLVLSEVGEDGEDGKYHYLYMNESSLDETYGFVEIDSVVVDQLIVPPSDVFSKVDGIRELDTVNIAMTDYGFWDLEKNQTNNITCSYKNGKEYSEQIGKFNSDKTKLISPTIQIDGAKYCEYSDDSGKYGINRLWSCPQDNQNWYVCHDREIDETYRNKIIGSNGLELDFFGGTQSFALYNSNKENRDGKEIKDPIHILVNLSQEQFTNLIFSDSQLINYFIGWLYEQVTHEPPTERSTRGEWYLYAQHGEDGFIGKLGEFLTDVSYDGLGFQLGEKYAIPESEDEPISLPISSKFECVIGNGNSKGIASEYDSTASNMSQYCAALHELVDAA